MSVMIVFLRKYLFVIFLSAVCINGAKAKHRDSTSREVVLPFKYSALIIPTVLMSYGFIGIESDGIKNYNAGLQEEVYEHIDDRLTLDDFSQYLPFVSVYGLNALGVKGKLGFKDRTIVLSTAYLIMGATVYSIKSISKVQRPDGSSNNSFPSGHTATAFMGAEFLWQEYKDVSPWYGIAGYVIATSTGAFRISNDRHWLTDVATGAGIGILSTKMAYWIEPWIKDHIFTKKQGLEGLVLPYYNGYNYGMCMSISF